MYASGRASELGNVFHGTDDSRKEIYNSKSHNLKKSETFKTYFNLAAKAIRSRLATRL